MSSYDQINLDDPRQDVHKQRDQPADLPRYRVALNLLEQAGAIAADDCQVLELGGGTGAFSKQMTAAGLQVTFADLNENNVARARESGLEAVQINLSEGLPGLPDNHYDGIVILEVIEHVVPAEKLLRDMNRVLKPGGFAILSTPNFNFILNRLRILMGGLSHDEGYHYRFFNPRVFSARLTKAGFYVERTHHTMPAFGYNLLANRLLGKPRLHVRVPNLLAGLWAHTLFAIARKPQSA